MSKEVFILVFGKDNEYQFDIFAERFKSHPPAKANFSDIKGRLGEDRGVCVGFSFLHGKISWCFISSKWHSFEQNQTDWSPNARATSPKHVLNFKDKDSVDTHHIIRLIDMFDKAMQLAPSPATLTTIPLMLRYRSSPIFSIPMNLP